MAVPAWKLALQERKKKQQEEEDLKKAKEEQQMLASLPAWKRAIIMRERKLAGAPPPSETSSTSSPIVARTGGSNVKQSSFAGGQQSQKWQVAVERVKGADSPVLKRVSPTIVRNDAAGHSRNISTSPAPARATETSHQKPAPQKSVMNRWNVGSSQSPTIKRSASAAGSYVSGSNSPAKPRSSVPRWPATGSSTSKTSTSTTGSSISKTSTSTTGSSISKTSTSTTRSSISKTSTSTTGVSTSKTSTSTTRVSTSKTSTSTTRVSTSKTSTSTTRVSTSKTSTSTTRVSTSKTSTSTTTGSSSSPVTSSKAATPTRTSSTKLTTSSNTNTTSTSHDQEDPTLANLPAWKRALILKKRKTLEKTESKDERSGIGEDETDSGLLSTSDQNKPASPVLEAAPVVIKQPVPEVVNRQAKAKPVEQRLVQQEGKTLHPPIYKEVDQWANVDEEDEKFKKLPLWKQALIKRRRVDIALRSGQPLPASSNEVQTTKDSPPKSKKETLKKPVGNDTTKKDREGMPKKSAPYKSKQLTSKRNTKVPEETAKKKPEPTKSTAFKSVSKAKPARLAPTIPNGVRSKTEEKSEPMFTFNFSKTSHRSLDTGDSSSDCTDSDLEDAIVTNLDEDSGESDSGIVLQRYAPSDDKSTSTEVKRTSSILVIPGSKKKNKLRRVAWSDSQLVCEHTYPKYDYSDYDDLEQETKGGDNSQLSHRLHPSLLPPTEGDPYAAGFSPPGYLQGGSLSNFVPSSLSPSIMENSYTDYSLTEPIKEESSPTRVPAEQDYSEYYSDQSNAGALLW